MARIGPAATSAIPTHAGAQHAARRPGVWHDLHGIPILDMMQGWNAHSLAPPRLQIRKQTRTSATVPLHGLGDAGQGFRSEPVLGVAGGAGKGMLGRRRSWVVGARHSKARPFELFPARSLCHMSVVLLLLRSSSELLGKGGTAGLADYLNTNPIEVLGL